MRIIRRIMWIVVVFGITTGSTMSVMAASNQEKAGRIQVILPESWDATKREGIPFSCTKIGEVKDGIYEILPQYESTAIDLNNLSTAQELEEAAKHLEGFGMQCDVTFETDVSGSVIFSGLEEGVYFVQAETGEQCDMVNPTIVAIPEFDEQSKTMSYEITIKPKHVAREQVNKRSAPQTGVETNARGYLMAGSGCFVIAGIIGVVEWRRKKEDEE